MLKKVKQKVGVVVSGFLIKEARTATAIRLNEQQILAELRSAGCKDGQVIMKDINPSNSDVFYYFEKETEVENFDEVDHNRYETYLNIVLDKYICVALATMEDVDEITLKRYYDYAVSKLNQDH